MTLDEFLSSSRLTVAEFADRIGVRSASVHRYRNRERIPRPEQMARIREATGGAVTADDFYPLDQGPRAS